MEDRENSVASAVSSTDFYESDKTPAGQVPNGPQASKRKADDLQRAREKKAKLEHAADSLPVANLSPCANLPPEIWQHIFLSCSLTTLGRLLQVNRSFHSYLTQVQAVPDSQPRSGRLRLLKSDSIWLSARNAHPTKPPKPLPGFSELHMWRLIKGKSCQFCNKHANCSGGDKVWEKGPGANGVRIVWAFGIRTCGKCLMEKCDKQQTLLFSAASALTPALPYTFVTADQNVISAHVLSDAKLPPHVDVTRHYYKEHVQDIIQEFEEAKGLGPAAAEEWYKGLESRGKERMRSAESWERWEVKYLWWLDHQDIKRPTTTFARTTSGSPHDRQVTGSPFRHHTSTPSFHANQQTPFQHPPPVSVAMPQPMHQHTPQPNYMHAQWNPPPPHQSQPYAAPPPQPYQQPYAQSYGDPYAQQYAQPPVPTPAPHSRAERSIQDANEAKAARKADIERRCQALNPPIPPNVLRHMESFKAALVISQPMTDHSWNMLYPRLMVQLPAAEQAEQEHAARVASLQTKAADRRHQDVNMKEVKEVLDREWEESQKPIRDLLSSYADQFINKHWSGGSDVTHDNSPKFAADLLINVRQSFYEDHVKVEETADQGNDAAPKRKLVLENMKWVYDNKIKPLTEPFRKELFLCNGTGCESNTRFYGFEGVIQHFGAKHTGAFSVGNIVVHWREAEWPEVPPFVPDPLGSKSSYYASNQGSGYASYQYGQYNRGGTITPHMPLSLPQASPGPYGQQQYNGYNGPYAPPPASYDYSHQYGQPKVDAYSNYQHPGHPYGTPGGNPAYMTSPAMSASAIAPPPGQNFTSPRQGPQAASATKQEAQAGERSSYYETQVSTLIRMAEEIWKKTAGIKDMPSSVRVYVMLHTVLSKFHLEFNHEPVLDHFIDAFSSHLIPKALKHATGLSCNACLMQQQYSASSSHVSRNEERRTYTVLALFSHFKSEHSNPEPGISSGYGHQPVHLDFKEDMIQLPGDRFISGLIHAPGMDDEKLHMVATVFPRLFPTPLPRIGVVDSNGVPSASHRPSQEPKEPVAVSSAPSVPSQPASVASRPRSSVGQKPARDEYDPLHPGIAQARAEPAPRGSTHQGRPLSQERRPLYHGESRYYLRRDPLDEEYHDRPPRGYMELSPSDPGFVRGYEEFREREPFYRDREGYRVAGPGGIVYAHPREAPGYEIEEYDPRYHEVVHYRDHDGPRPEYRLVREGNARPRGSSNSGPAAEADRFLSGLNPANRPGPPNSEVKAEDADLDDDDDGSRYTPPPASVPPTDGQQDDRPSQPAPLAPAPQLVPQSRYEEYQPSGPGYYAAEPGSASRRNGPSRRRYNDHVPSRYYRYMTVDRNESQPRPQGQNMSRSSSRVERKYDRYEQQRRRIVQEETPQPKQELDPEPAFSRDQSVDQGYLEDPYHRQTRARDYVPVDDDPRIRYRYDDDPPDGRQPGFADPYGERVQYVRVYREPRVYDDPYSPRPPTQYVPGPASDHVQYVPVPSHRGPPLPRDVRYDDRPSPYVYYEERERSRRLTYEPEGASVPPEARPESKGPPLAVEADPPM